MRRPWSTPGALVGAILLLAGCGDRAPQPATPAPAPAPVAAAPPAGGSAPSGGATGATTAAAPPAETADFQRLEARWADALATKDRAALEGLLAPEFLVTGVGSTVGDPVGVRLEWLGNVGKYPWPRHEVLDVRVLRAAVDVAVVKCIWRGLYPPHSLTEAGGAVSLLETDVWVWRNGRWWVVARHTSLPHAE
jgi:hypothetical protein